MPLATLHLVALQPGTSVAQYAHALRSTLPPPQQQPLVVARVVRWIIRPEQLSATRLLSTQWDVLVIMRADADGSPSADAQQQLFAPGALVAQHWSLTAGVPRAQIAGFGARNAELLHPPPASDSGTTTAAFVTDPNHARLAASAQQLQATRDLLHWSTGEAASRSGGAVSMLNLLAFRPGADARASYQRYGRAFADGAGKRHGGVAKLVGRVVPARADDEDRHGWDEFALAHYPSARHFVAMLAADDYQRANREARLPALRDTCILCTSEMDPALGAGAGAGAGAEGRARL